MPFGNSQVLAQDNVRSIIYGKLIGWEGFHSHFRWRIIKNLINFQEKQTLEVGAGTGLMTFEITKRLHSNATLTASEYDSIKYKRGER